MQLRGMPNEGLSAPHVWACQKLRDKRGRPFVPWDILECDDPHIALPCPASAISHAAPLAEPTARRPALRPVVNGLYLIQPAVANL
jgi:hypothetical protein